MLLIECECQYLFKIPFTYGWHICKMDFLCVNHPWITRKKHKHFFQIEEVVKKDVEHCFGVLWSQFIIVQIPSWRWHKKLWAIFLLIVSSFTTWLLKKWIHFKLGALFQRTSNSNGPWLTYQQFKNDKQNWELWCKLHFEKWYHWIFVNLKRHYSCIMK
jgi:hypothetical protein